jgi:hypothetical protein
MTDTHAEAPKVQITVDVTGWTEPQRAKLLGAITDVQRELATLTAVAAVGHGWSPEAFSTLISRLHVGRGKVQAQSILAAITNGGEISREQVFEIGEYGEGRSLKGFTRPINRLVKEMKGLGEVADDAADPFVPVYDDTIKAYQQAKKFRVHAGIVEMYQRRSAAA